MECIKSIFFLIEVQIVACERKDIHIVHKVKSQFMLRPLCPCIGGIQSSDSYCLMLTCMHTMYIQYEFGCYRSSRFLDKPNLYIMSGSNYYISVTFLIKAILPDNCQTDIEQSTGPAC